MLYKERKYNNDENIHELFVQLTSVTPHVTHQVPSVSKPLVALGTGKLSLIREAGGSTARPRCEGRGHGPAALALDVGQGDSEASSPATAHTVPAVQPDGAGVAGGPRVARLAGAVSDEVEGVGGHVRTAQEGG